MLVMGPWFGCLSAHPVVSNSWRPHGLQHARPPCPSPTPGLCPSSCPLHQWWRLTISSSDAPFSFCHQSFPASGTFPMNLLFTSDNQNTGASASAKVLLGNMQASSPLRLTGLICHHGSLAIPLSVGRFKSRSPKCLNAFTSIHAFYAPGFILGYFSSKGNIQSGNPNIL